MTGAGRASPRGCLAGRRAETTFKTPPRHRRSVEGSAVVPASSKALNLSNKSMLDNQRKRFLFLFTFDHKQKTGNAQKGNNVRSGSNTPDVSCVGDAFVVVHHSMQ